MTWVLIVWVGLILAWAIAAAASSNSQSVQNCAKGGYVSVKTCQSAADAGTGIGIALILFVGFIGFVFFGLIWIMTRPRKRICPVCGEGVKRGLTRCPSCEHDFAAHTGAVMTT